MHDKKATCSLLISGSTEKTNLLTQQIHYNILHENKKTTWLESTKKNGIGYQLIVIHNGLNIYYKGGTHLLRNGIIANITCLGIIKLISEIVKTR
jgi:hypothetical protein